MTMFHSQSIEKYRSDIDGLRAIAVLLVVAYHAFPLKLRAGFIGVDIFFVISGFLISTIIFQSLQQQHFSFIAFYRRRIQRLFPSLIVVLSASLIFGWFMLFADEYQQLGKHTLAGVEFISNFTLWKESGYFDSLAETKPLLHLWSLSIEEQFYIIWPVLLWLVWKKKRNAFIAIFIIASVSFGLNISKVRTNAIASFYSPQTRFWELLIGCSLAYLMLYKQTLLQKFHRQFRNNGATIQAFFGAFILLLGLVFISKEKHFPGFWGLLPTFGAALIIAAGSQAWLNRIILSNPVMVWIGLISFPLYLWHWPLLVFTRVLDGETPLISTRIVAVLLAIGLAYMTYRYVERPLRFGHFNKTKTASLLVLLMFLLGVGGYSIKLNHGFPQRVIAKKAMDFVYETEQFAYLPCEDHSLVQGITFGYCLLNAEAKVNAALIGDSHAEDKFHGLVKNDHKHHWMLMGNSSCPPVYGIRVETEQDGCQEKFEKILTWLQTRPEIKTVALSYYGNYFLTTNYAADHLNRNIGPERVKISSAFGQQSRASLFQLGISNAITMLQKANKKVILFVDVPELPFFPRDCARNFYRHCQLTKKEVDLRQAELRAMIEKLKKDHPKLLVFDPINLFCKKGSCQYTHDKKILYRDSHHLSLAGSDMYANYFVDWDRMVTYNRDLLKNDV